MAQCGMLTRRVLFSASLAAPLAGITATPALAARKPADGFSAYLAGLRAEALRIGISPQIVAVALRDQPPNARVLQLDQHQPEFSLTWAQYRARVLPAARLQSALVHATENASTLDAVQQRYGVDYRIILGIWGLESGFGAKTGSFNIINALATLAYHGRRAAYFRGELMNALRILNAGDIGVAGITGSWAGAMGQPQFMPSSYLRYAVDFDGDGKRDIWNTRADVFGSVGNYLAKSGWQPGVPWGQAILLPPGFAQATGRDRMRPLGAWQAEGVRRVDGRPFSRADVPGAVVQPDGAGTEAFMVYANFHVIRRYNPSDFYALAVGLLGNAA
jgi:membrane-bound lytic murein transglycosylase B